MIQVMKTHTLEITLAELQAALRAFCLQRGHDPTYVNIVSYDKTISVEMGPKGLIISNEFKHRAN